MIVTHVRALGHAPHEASGRKTLQMHGFPIQMYGKTSKCHNFNSKVLNQNSFKSTFLVPTHSACPCKNYAAKCSQKPYYPGNYYFFQVYINLHVIQFT